MFNAQTFANWIYEKRKALSILAVFVYLACTAGLLTAKFESDFRLFFPKDSQLIQTFDDISDTYEQGDNLVIYLKFDQQQALDFDKLKVIEQADSLANKLPYVRTVRSLSSFQKSFSIDDELENKFVGEWGEELNADKQSFGPVSHFIDEQELLRGGLVSDHGAGAIILAEIDLPQPLYVSTEKVMLAAEELAAQLEKEHGSVSVYVSGTAAFDSGLFTEFVNFLSYVFPLVVVLVTLAVIWVSGSFWVTMAGLTASSFTLVATAGIFGWLPVSLDQTAITATLLVMILTVVDCIHIGSTYIVCVQNRMSKEAALIESVRVNLKPVFFTTLTTSVGLITLLFTGSPPFILFAMIALVGILIGFVFSFIFMTALSSWFPMPNPDKAPPTDKLIKKVNQLVMAQPKKIVMIFIGLTGLSVVGISQNYIDEDISHYFMPGHPLDDAIEVMREDFVASNSISIAIKPDNGNVLTPAVYQSINEFEIWLKDQPGHINSLSINDVIREIKAVWGNEEGYIQLPESSEEYAQYLLIYEMSLLYGQSSAEIIAADRSETLVTVSLKDLSNKEILKLEEGIQAWWANKTNAIQIEVSGRDVIFAHLSEKTVYQSIIGAALAAALITVFMIFTFRSVKWGLFSLIPNVLPFVFLFGVWGVVYGEISQATCMAFTIVLGIVVDDSIHFVFKFRDSKSKMNLADAMTKTYQFVGYAITGTTVAFIVDGFVLFFFSGFTPNAIMGAVMVVILISAWLCDLLLMPALLVLYYQRKESAQLESHEALSNVPMHEEIDPVPHLQQSDNTALDSTYKHTT